MSEFVFNFETSISRQSVSLVPKTPWYTLNKEKLEENYSSLKGHFDLIWF